jgi:CHASE2 domain-containing sensor protein
MTHNPGIEHKPKKKGFRHHARKVHGRVTKYLYERDTIFATLWVFIFMFGVSFIKINMHFFDPIKHALHDFDVNDAAFSQVNPPDKFDPRIVLINIGQADREGIAALIDKTASYNPKVMGLDVLFEGPRDPVKDSILLACFGRHKNLVSASKIVAEEEGKIRYMMKGNFDNAQAQKGFVNLIGEDIGTTRLFSPWEKIQDTDRYAFAPMLVKSYDPAVYERLMKRKDHEEIINYTRRYTQHMVHGQVGINYLVIEPDVLLNNEVDSTYFSGKIAILAYVNTNDFDIEDKKFTPMNEKLAGKQYPDMSGAIIHANIISMMIDNNYINKLPGWVAILVAVLIGWLHMSFFIHYYIETHLWFHLAAKLAQLASAILFAYIGMYLFNRYRIKLDMSLTIIVIVLSVDIIYFYEAFATWMHKKFGYKTVFHQKHH